MYRVRRIYRTPVGAAISRPKSFDFADVFYKSYRIIVPIILGRPPLHWLERKVAIRGQGKVLCLGFKSSDYSQELDNSVISHIRKLVRTQNRPLSYK